MQIGDGGTEFEGRVAFWKDRYLVSIMKNNPEKTENATLRQVAQRIADRIAGSASPPEVLTYLPPKGLVPRSRGYVKGLLGLNSQIFLDHDNFLELGKWGVEGAFARYQHQKNEAVLILVRYPSANRAQKKKDQVVRLFSKKYELLEGSIDRFKDKKGRGHAVQVRRKFLFIIFKADSPRMIDHLTQQLKGEPYE